jgi:hypothetical protein
MVSSNAVLGSLPDPIKLRTQKQSMMYEVLRLGLEPRLCTNASKSRLYFMHDYVNGDVYHNDNST